MLFLMAHLVVRIQNVVRFLHMVLEFGCGLSRPWQHLLAWQRLKFGSVLARRHTRSKVWSNQGLILKVLWRIGGGFVVRDYLTWEKLLRMMFAYEFTLVEVGRRHNFWRWYLVRDLLLLETIHCDDVAALWRHALLERPMLSIIMLKLTQLSIVIHRLLLLQRHLLHILKLMGTVYWILRRLPLILERNLLVVAVRTQIDSLAMPLTTAVRETGATTPTLFI